MDLPLLQEFKRPCGYFSLTSRTTLYVHLKRILQARSQTLVHCHLGVYYMDSGGFGQLGSLSNTQ